MSEEREVKIVHRYPPCPEYDIEAMESWLSDMAAEGLVLTRDGFFFGFGYFEKTEPKAMRYRLEATKNRSGTLNEFNPPEEAQELYETMGWQYVAARGNFHIYCTEDPEARELHTDPQVQAITIDTLRKKIRRDIVFEVVWILLLVGIRVGFIGNSALYGAPLVLSAIAIGTPAAILFLAIIIWAIADMVRKLRKLSELRRKAKNGEELDHGKEWRKGRIRYWLGLMINWLITIIFFGLIFSSCLRSVDNKNEIPLDEFTGTLPFATMRDFISDSSFEPDKTSLGYQLNTVEFRSDLLAPVVIDFDENGCIYVNEEMYINGGLGVTYIEARNEWLAKEVFREFKNSDKGSKRYKPLKLSLEGVDQCEAFVDIFPTVVLRKGNIVVRADFYHSSENKISLEQWAGTIAASIAG